MDIKGLDRWQHSLLTHRNSLITCYETDQSPSWLQTRRLTIQWCLIIALLEFQLPNFNSSSYSHGSELWGSGPGGQGRVVLRTGRGGGKSENLCLRKAWDARWGGHAMGMREHERDTEYKLVSVLKGIDPSLSPLPNWDLLIILFIHSFTTCGTSLAMPAFIIHLLPLMSCMIAKFSAL